jgi:hypothetical protein
VYPVRLANSPGAQAPCRCATDEGDLRDDIVELEARIEDLAQAIESCAKVIQISRVAIAMGAVLFLTTMSGVIRFDPLVMIAAITAVIGGIVFLGSNRSTADQAKADLQAAELRRAELIGAINPRIVGDQASGLVSRK